jgi:charged multivesicular body protein 4
MGGKESKEQPQPPQQQPKPPANQNNNNQKQSPSTPTPPPPKPVAVKKRQVQNEKANSTDMAILELKLQREKLKKATEKYCNLSEKMKQAAREAMLQDPERNKANALFLIKRSKLYEHQLESTSAQLLNLETSLNAIEDGVIQVQVMKSLEMGAKALDSINQQLSRADEVMENVREAVAAQREISDILGAPVGDLSDVADEDDLEDELNKIMNPNGKAKINNKTQQVNNKIDENLLVQVKVPSHEPAVVPQQKIETTENVAEKEKEAEERKKVAA